jgi:hypothetical protein
MLIPDPLRPPCGPTLACDEHCSRIRLRAKPVFRQSARIAQRRFSILMAVSLWQRLAQLSAPFRRLWRRSSSASRPRILVVVEGRNDVEFLRRVSRIPYGQKTQSKRNC